MTSDRAEYDRGIDRSVLQGALEEWGEEAQIDMAGEELSELDVALHRLLRGRASEEDVVEEIADVLIMMEQLALVFGEDRVAEQVQEKMARLEDRLEEANA